MRTTILAVILCFVMGSVYGQAAANWEVRKKPSGQCEVIRVAASPGPGTRVAGPYKNKKRAEDELVRLRKTPKCKK
jgi:hypothetical protein